ncbi:hypothetical protein [Emticicia agri]|nr:hypothetical protein [Emticicia agri]
MDFFMIIDQDHLSQNYTKRTKKLIFSAKQEGTIVVIEANELWNRIALLLNRGERVFLSKKYFKELNAHFESKKSRTWDTIKNIAGEIGLSHDQALYFLEESLSERKISETDQVLNTIKNLKEQIRLFEESTENINILNNKLISIKSKDIYFLISHFKWSIFAYHSLQTKVILYQAIRKLRFPSK